MKNKKSEFNFWWIVISGVLALGIFVILGSINVNLFGKSKVEASSFIDDFDEDGIKNYLDKCDCLVGKEENSGCPANVKIEDTDKLNEIKNECKEEMKGKT